LFSFQYYIYRVYHARVYLKVSFKDDKGIYQQSVRFVKRLITSVILLRHSKTDQYSQGKIIPISEELSGMISSWSLAIDQDNGYILRSFKRNLSVNTSLTPASINHILKSLQKQAGQNQIGELSGHSFRVGAALDLLDKNIPLEKIMLRGGWKSETSAMRYLQSWSDQDWLIAPSHHS